LEVLFLKKLSDKLEKERIKYNILFVPDDKSETVKHFSMKLDILVVLCTAIIFVVVAAVVYGIIITVDYNKVNKNVVTLKSEVEDLTAQNSSLETENSELQEKVAILSSTVNEKVQQQEEQEAQMAQSYIPSGFPLKGTATYNEDETELDGNPIALFHASEDTSVIAAASGTVESIEKVADGYVVTIDHENGYKSIYRNGEKPKVVEGDTVTSDTEIYRIKVGSEELGYQIMENDEYIDPLDLMEIYG
jgi:murein DD-endopeptidase MepM/ murein hydrolase activator NlpD